LTHLLKTHIKQSILPAFGDSKRRDNLSFTRDFHHCAHDLDAPKKISRQTAGRKGRKTRCRPTFGNYINITFFG